MHALVLQAVEKTFAGRVIPAISFAAHRREHSVRGELLLKIVAAILAAAIRVMNQPRRRAPTEPCHAQGVDHQLLGHPLAHRPAYDLPGVQIENDRQIQPLCSAIIDVAHSTAGFPTNDYALAGTVARKYS